ncbi:hypothetical protein Nepgr_025064 [Nepenthes gracilis]|uniref:CST complex subunit CTC1 n=1 Tax=Nepenthes gracilis TaxID=150966 RepID=A0AAD3Y139_NEPGR|nr:hypothetical protein Nepgr_025064 [Nepenthes gracilis]
MGENFDSSNMMEGVKVVSILDLLKWRRPISGTFSLLPPKPLTAPPSTCGGAITRNPNSSRELKVLKSLANPSIIIGTLSLPKSDDSSSPNSGCDHHCFSFSDDSASVCCDVLGFDVRMIGKKVYILAWNFIPFKHRGGFLEIIKWKSQKDSSSSVDLIDLFPLVLGSFSVGEGSHKARYRVTGILGSISPVSDVPCTVDSVQNDASGMRSTKTVHGFIVQFFACECKLCSSNDITRNLFYVIDDQERHSFSKKVFAYFSRSSSSWHPAFSKLIGSVISLSRLRKKLVYIKKEEALLMFVTTDETCLHMPKLDKKRLSLSNTAIRGKGECGDYAGVVRSIHLQGMVVELDDEVWLLLTDQLLTFPHSVRVGAVICARNVHFVIPKFSWRKMLLLGACCKTSIIVATFSPLEARCHLPSQSQSQLGKYIQSLVFSARLWLLLVAQCFRKKFTGKFSEKGILGSKHSEGLAQAYAKSILPSLLFQPLHGIFMQFCKHDSCGCCSELNFSSLTLVVPFVNFINNCEVLWIKSLVQKKGGLEMIEHKRHVSCLRDFPSFGQLVRKTIPSKEIGVTLLGNLKVSACTGRLQLMDATGSIDAVVPDLPSTWSINDIYEVTNYTLVLEGVPERMNHAMMLDNDSFSCRSIFSCLPSERETGLGIYVFFTWRNASHRCFPTDHGLDSNNSMELGSGTFHLLHLSHIFPVQPNFHDHMLLSERSSMFAEALVLPWDLCLIESKGAALPIRVSKDKEEECWLNGFTCKSTNSPCNWVQSSGTNNLEIKSSSHSIDLCNFFHKCRRGYNSSCTSLVEIPCSVTIRGLHGESMVNSGILSPNRADCRGRIRRLKKVLLEFSSENFLKYKSLCVGAYYITKHCMEESFCNYVDPNYDSKVVIKPGMQFWSLSFSFNESDSNSDPPQSPSSEHCSSSVILSAGYNQAGLVFHSCNGINHDNFVDINLHVPADAVHLLDMKHQALNEGRNTNYVMPIDIACHCQPKDGRTIAKLQCPEASQSGCPLLEGDLVSLHGTVVALHSYDSCPPDGNSCDGSSDGIHLLGLFQGGRIYICLHVLIDDRTVKIDGSLTKYNYPIGLGPGANVNFHRILAFSGHNRFMLTPVSFISVNYVEEVTGSCSNKPSNLRPPFSFGCILPETLSLCSIFDLIHSSECKPRRFHCRVVAVHILMLERINKLDSLLSKIHYRIPVVDIPLAGFVLDDGSSPCCCWANGETAATFLRLHEEMPETSFGSCWWGLEGMGRAKACRTPCLHLDKILKKHGRITVKNYGSIHDSLCQDLHLSVGSDCILSTLDENVLKFIILNACSSINLCVVGHVMHSDAQGAYSNTSDQIDPAREQSLFCSVSGMPMTRMESRKRKG